MVDAGQRAKQRRHVRPAPRVVIVVGPPARAGRTYRVHAPDRVLRMFELLTAARDELDLAALAAQDRARIQRLLDVVRAEIERSVSPALADELRNLVRAGSGRPARHAAPRLTRHAARRLTRHAAPRLTRRSCGWSTRACSAGSVAWWWPCSTSSPIAVTRRSCSGPGPGRRDRRPFGPPAGR